MSLTAICVDANIIVRLITPDPDRDVFHLWRQWRVTDTEIFAPTLLKFEAVNALHRRCVAGKTSESLTEELIATLLELPITYMNDNSLHLEAFRLARKYGQPAAYDMHYVALAQHLGAELWTADKRLYNAVHQQLDFVRLVV
jgi:predicted nucleic acid-binding protein